MPDPRVRDLFDRVADLTAPERAKLLAAADAGVRAEVEALLAHDTAEETALRLRSPLERGTDPTAANGRSAEFPLPMQIGRYRIVGFLGQGGMGAVYEAEQDNPRRGVALKVIRPGSISRGAARRFANEASVLGRLQHPGIAQVYDAGVTDDGQPFFAMELVRGVPLDMAASALDVPGRVALVAQIAEAVQHAHDRGVIHRDLKPSNVLVDERGQPKVLDFGVARVAGLEASQTQTGEIIGTFAYMSPEQLAGLPLDGRTDVYALGVILYRLLAGQSPYELDGLPLAEVGRVVRDLEPTALGLIDARLRGDVETIVAKALEKSPERRYATAAEFAADLRRHLAHEPIHAKPATWIYRLNKFARRHTAVVVGTTTVVLALAIGWIATSLALLRARTAESEASQALHAIEIEQAKTRDALAVSDKDRIRTRALLFELTSDVVARMLARQEVLGQSEREFLRRMLSEFHKFADDHNDAFEARSLRAEGLVQIARIHLALGDLRAAIDGYRMAVNLYDGLAAERPDEPEWRRCLGAACSRLAESLNNSGDRTEAEKFVCRAASVHQRLAAEFPDAANLQSQYVTRLVQLGTIVGDQGRHKEAETIVRNAVAAAEKAAIQFPNDAAIRQNLALCFDYLGVALAAQNRSSESEAAFRLALAGHERAAALAPADVSHRANAAATANNLGRQLQLLKRWDDARAAIERSIAEYGKIVGEFPAQPAYRAALAHAHNDLGQLMFSRGRPNAAEAPFRRVIEILTPMLVEFPDSPSHALEYGGACANLGVALAQRGQNDESMEWSSRAVERLEATMRRDPRSASARLFLRNALWSRANVLERQKRFAEAVADWERSIEIVEEHERADPRTRLTLACARSGQWRRAADVAAQVETTPHVHPLRWNGLAVALSVCAADAPESAEKEEYGAKAVAFLKRAKAAGAYQNAAYLNELRTNPDFDALRRRTDFEALLAELEPK